MGSRAVSSRRHTSVRATRAAARAFTVAAIFSMADASCTAIAASLRHQPFERNDGQKDRPPDTEVTRKEHDRKLIEVKGPEHAELALAWIVRVWNHPCLQLNMNQV